MAEDFRSDSGSRNWRNSRESLTFIDSGSSSAACSAPTDITGSFGWSSDMADIRARPSSVPDSSITLFPDHTRKQQDLDSTAPGNGTVFMDSNSPMTGVNLSSSTASSDLNSDMMQWSPKNYSAENVSGGGGVGGEDSTIASPFFKPLVRLNQGIDLDQHRTILNDVGNCATAFLMGSTSYGHPSSSTFIHSNDDLVDRNRSSSVLDYYRSNELSSPVAGDFLKPTFPKIILQPTADHHWQLSNSNAALSPPWSNESTVTPVGSSSLFCHPVGSPQFLPPAFEDKPNLQDLSTKTNFSTEELLDTVSSVGKTGGGESLFKRSRIETSSPMSTFKGRKEKMGDRITTLQQLVSPFGKTDTASVLHEAIEYIKFLHDQVSVLSTPYMKNGAPIQSQQQVEDGERRRQDLRSQGLCLVQLPNTFPAANQTSSTDFWAPAFGLGGTFRPPN